jgi:hypothetical protein
MIVRGTLQEVLAIPQGSSLTSDLSSGATVLPVSDLTDFPETGSVQVGGVTYTYMLDEAAGTLVIPGPGLTAAADEGESVAVVSPGSGLPEEEWFALVDADEAADSEPLRGEIPTDLIAYFPEGEGLAGAEVLLESTVTGYRVVSMPNEPPVFDAAVIDPDTEATPTTAPASSPELTVVGMPTSLVVTAGEVAASTQIEYHLRTTSGSVTAGDAATLLTTTRSRVIVVTHLPDDVTPLARDTTYYLRAIAVNDVGAAAQSTEKSAQLDPSGITSLVTERLVAGYALLGTLEVGSIDIDPVTGITVPQPNNPEGIHFPTDGSSATIKGVEDLQVEKTTLTGQTNLYGPTSVGDTVTYEGGVTAPTSAPTGVSALNRLLVSWGETYDPVAWPTTLYTTLRGLTDTADGTEWITAEVSGVYTINKTTGVVTPRIVYSAGMTAMHGVVRIGSTYYIAYHWSGTHSVLAYNSSWVYQGNPYNVSNATKAITAFGTNGTDLLTVYNTGQLVDRISTAGTVTATIGLQAGYLTNTTTVIETAADFGATRIVVASGSTIRVFNNLTGARVTGDEWSSATVVAGIVWDGTRFITATNAGRVYAHSTYIGGVSESVTLSQTLTDGTAETAKSVASAAVTRFKRGWIFVTAATPPSSPAGLYPKVYAGTSTRRLQTTTPALSTTNFQGYIDALNTGSAVEPAAQSGTFAALLGGHRSARETVPGQPDWEFYGDGTWYIKGLPYQASGSITTGTMTAGTDKNVSISFGVTFAAAPIVVVSVAGVATNGGGIFYTSVDTVTTTGADLNALRTSGTAAFTLNWIAVGTLA